MRPGGDGRARRTSSIQQEGVAPAYSHGQHGVRPRVTWRNCMPANESSDRQPADAADVQAKAIDVHNHAMPLPLLEWLERAGLADLSRIGDDVVLLDPAVSGVAKNAPLPRPLPVRPSHPTGRDGQRRGSNPCGVHAAVSVLLQLRRRTARHHNDRARQRRAGRLHR